MVIGVGGAAGAADAPGAAAERPGHDRREADDEVLRSGRRRSVPMVETGIFVPSSES